ncbi:restriction endonuclease subunit S [uncultured Treponema sp.]|uniref:restriction endonuclease subunit S n=1 Tax=uncultured Treponema sp. TaxID=162155 RepID=UPI002804A128|nr:restriction endonuclease subunit S [uncultured Treponema sp.]
MEEWKECRLGEICTKITDGSHFSPQACQTGYPMFSVKDMLEYGFDYSNCKHISAKDFESMKNGDCVPQKGDILVAKDGSFLKQIFECKETKEEAILSSIAMFRPNQDFITPTFLCYLLRSPKVYNYIASNCVSGSALPRIVLKDFKKVSMQVPPLPTQQKIAAILSSLDDKIELNNKININLEQQAGVLFKNWFVDFEPFGGKMPEEWKVGKLCDIADYSSEKIEINKLSPETYYSTENMLPSKGGIETATSLPSISQTTRCLPGETIISNIRPYFKKIFYCTEEVAGCSTDVLCFKPKYKDYSEYLYQVLYSDIFFDYMVLGSKGTKMPRGDKQQIMNYPITIPNELYLRKFKTFAEPIFSQIDLNRKENKRLSELRDTLLPKLMNGEIEV